MATWEDGPEYAPIQPPDGFAGPQIAPLEVVPAPPRSAAGAPADRPVFDQPQTPVAALADLVPVPPDRRDPQVPFDVVAATVTEATSAWSAAHWTPPQPATVAAEPVGPVGSWGPPSGTPWTPASSTAWSTGATPASVPVPPNPQAPVPDPGASYPPPGTAEWFVPGAPTPPPAPPPPLTAAQVMTTATPGLLICLLVGGLIYPLSPVTLCLAFGLASRLRVARTRIRQVFGLTLIALAVIAVFALTITGLDFSDWWLVLARWAQGFSWILAVTVCLLVFRGLKKGGSAPPPPRTWG